jgi:tetratricopeptide (TPR) repeat protein
MADNSTTTSSDAFDVALEEGQRAAMAGDLPGAQAKFRQCRALRPNDPSSLERLGLILGNLNLRDDAIAVLEAALSQGASVTAVLYLAAHYEAAGRPTDAWTCYKRVLKVAPKDTYTLLKLGALKDKFGDKPGARECYRLAYESNPDDIETTSKYTNALWAKDPETALSYSERLVAMHKDSPEHRIGALGLVICQKEWYERIKRGLMPYHCSRVDELFFNFGLDYVKQLEATYREVLAVKRIPSMLIGLAAARFAQKDRHDAEALLSASDIQSKLAGTIYENIRFAPAFYDELRAMPDEDLLRDIPPLIEVTLPCPDPKGVLYLSCNYMYFYAFALPMIVSMCDRSPLTAVHVHIMDADEEQTALALAFLKALNPLKFALSIERPGLQTGKTDARCYYHAIRFIRYYEHLKLYNSPLWLMDVDAVVNRDLGELFGQLEGKDVAMRIRPGRLEPWNQFNACIVGASQTPASLEYFRLVAAYIAHFHQKKMLRWGIDQLAMYGVYADMEDRSQAPTLALLGEPEVDYDYREDGFVWCNSGIGKFRHLQRISNPSAMPLANFEENKFVATFEQRWNETQRIANSIPAKRGKTAT